MDKFSDKILRNICDAVFYGYPNPPKMKELLTDIVSGTIRSEYHFGNNLNFAFDYSVLKKQEDAVHSYDCKFRMQVQMRLLLLPSNI